MGWTTHWEEGENKKKNTSVQDMTNKQTKKNNNQRQYQQRTVKLREQQPHNINKQYSK